MSSRKIDVKPSDGSQQPFLAIHCNPSDKMEDYYPWALCCTSYFCRCDLLAHRGAATILAIMSSSDYKHLIQITYLPNTKRFMMDIKRVTSEAQAEAQSHRPPYNSLSHAQTASGELSLPSADERHDTVLSWRDVLEKDVMAFFLMGILVSGHSSVLTKEETLTCRRSLYQQW